MVIKLTAYQAQIVGAIEAAYQDDVRHVWVVTSRKTGLSAIQELYRESGFTIVTTK